MVRSMSRGQFHVTSAWDGYAALGGSETEEVIVPSELEEEPDLTELLETVPPELLEPPPPEPTELFPKPPAPFDLSRSEPSPAMPALPAPAALALTEGSDPSPPVVAAPENPAAPVLAQPPEASRTLVGLLARMWLLRSTVGANSGSAIAGPSLVTVDSTRAPATAPPAPPAAPPPTPPLSPPFVEHSTLLPPDVDDRRPMGGLATFLVELAEVAHPTPVPMLPPNGGSRARVVVRLLHCTSHVPERLVSRDACRLPRVGR